MFKYIKKIYIEFVNKIIYGKKDPSLIEKTLAYSKNRKRFVKFAKDLKLAGEEIEYRKIIDYSIKNGNNSRQIEVNTTQKKDIPNLNNRLLTKNNYIK